MIKMKDLTKRNLLWNVAPKNPTQTALSRFQKAPHGAMRSMFTDSVENFEKNNPLKKLELDTPFSDILGPFVLGGEDTDD